jgi:hypothetical protein
MTTGTILQFIGVCMIAYVMPGPDCILVAKSALKSRWSGFVATAGVQTGLAIHGTIAAPGLSALIASTPEALRAVQVAGAGCSTACRPRRLVRVPMERGGIGDRPAGPATPPTGPLPYQAAAPSGRMLEGGPTFRLNLALPSRS